ncbi:type VII secretion protein EccCa [Solwaraspora sp. WMMA2101]|uniref:type VII secretion protein EccCa n=1 Tax=Solwaraspora sp. WMMA2101 TaxID=3404124 RepID=UPI003B95AB1E
MSGTVLDRPARQPAPDVTGGEIRIAAPPSLPTEPTGVAGRWQQAFMLLPALGGSVAAAMALGQGGGAYPYLMGAVFAVSALAMLATSWQAGGGAATASEMDVARRRYLRYLAELRRQVRQTAVRQRAALCYRHPDPHTLWSTAASSRVWERRAGDDDFGVVRVGVGPQRLATALVAPTGQAPEDVEPLTAAAVRRFVDTYAVVPDLPATVALPAWSRIVVTTTGNRSAPHVSGESPAWDGGTRPERDGGTRPERDGGTRPAAVVRAMLAQLAVFHPPDELRIAVCAAPQRRPAWEWTKWLPHVWHPQRHDAAGALRLVATDVAELAPLVAPLVAAPPSGAGPATGTGAHLVVVLDGVTGDLPTLRRDSGGTARLTVIEVDPTPATLDPATLELAIGPDGRFTDQRSGPTAADGVRTGLPATATADQLSTVEAEALARQLTPLRLAAGDRTTPGSAAEADLIRLLGLDAAPAARWWTADGPVRGPAAGRQLRVPIGVDADGRPVELDLKESAAQGMGPHGMVVGATGSGKSELLRTLVLGLALSHPPEELNVVLVDFKGGATFAALDRLPHTAAVITNLARELPLVDRMADSLTGEVVRRQDLLRRAGNLASRQEYLRARQNDPALPPLPALLIVCDEFTELLTAKPDFIEVFGQIGRLGRSLGIHLLLASQRVDEGRLRGLDTHLSYRIGLRTFSALESRAILGVPDAYHLPRDPGHGFLAYGTEPPVRFRAAYVSGPYRRPRPRPAGGRRRAPRLYDYRTAVVPAVAPEPVVAPPVTGPSLLDVTVDRLARYGPTAHQVWLPPLDTSPRLDDLLGPVRPVPGRGLQVADPAVAGRLRVPVALVDKPAAQQRDPLWLSLDAAAGHLAVVGAPQAGKSHLLRTVVCALALAHTPDEVQLYCLDFGGGTLAGLRELPHVGAVAGRADTATVRRTVAEVADLLAVRERRFAALGVDSMPAYRRRRAAVGVRAAVGGDAADGPADDLDRYGDVFLVVDGWPTLRGEYDDLEQPITDLATRGLSYGVHLVASAPRWTDFRPALRDLFGSRLELRLGDPVESMVSRRSAGNVPAQPGRGLSVDGFHFRTALAEVGETALAEVAEPGANANAVTDAGAGTAGLVAAIARHWPGRGAPPVRLLPDLVPYAEFSRVAGAAGDGADGLRLAIGLAEADLRPAAVDFAADPHLVVFGEAESGKSAFLRALATSIVDRFVPEQARLIIVDYRRSLLGAVTSPHLIGYGSTPSHTADLIASAASYLRDRLPGPEVTAGQLAARSWWSGPELFVLVDDHDLVDNGGPDPLLPLVEHLAQARDVGLHLVLARRSGGAARALYRPVQQRLRELSSAGLVLRGDPDEGPLVGPVRPTPLPPGRGWLVTRREPTRLIQLAYLPPPVPDGHISLPKSTSGGGESR